MLALNDTLERIPRVGAATLQKLSKLGIVTVRDMLLHVPFRYEDYSRIAPIRSLHEGESVSVVATVRRIATRRSFRSRVSVCEAIVADDTGTLTVVWFNQPYIERYISIGDRVVLSGTIERREKLHMVSPLYRVIIDDGGTHSGQIFPVYRATKDLTQKQLRYIAAYCVTAAHELEEMLPSGIVKKYDLMGYADAIATVHKPGDTVMLARARRRLAFEELFLIQTKSHLAKRELSAVSAPRINCQEDDMRAFISKLPFALTEDQQRTADEICSDMRKKIPMNRLLEGDVGSGKTIVAAIAMFVCARVQLQSVLLAPTELLAKQHFETLRTAYRGQSVRIALLTHSISASNTIAEISKKDVLRGIQDGSFEIIVGTHALIQERVVYHKIGLIVIDEQHRFGVAQRSALKEKNSDGLVPHFLSMTATPIPRSLALIVYGDLDISILKQMPRGRKGIITKVISERGRKKAYQFIDAQVRQGRQVFVICPLIDPSDVLGVTSVMEEFEILRQDVFPRYTIGLLHGKLKTKEKDDVMRSFRDGTIQILVSTSVVEVGIDVPNATVMMIEGAERFGLAQLHQFRGRVGRGEYQSYCLLLTRINDQEAIERLRMLERSSDGFSIAEHDLRHRGPGDVYGVQQSGMMGLTIASIHDTALISETKDAVEWYFSRHDIDDFTPLKSLLSEADPAIHFE